MLEEKFLRIIEEYNLIKPQDKIVVGVSGGPDSVVLLHLLNQIKEKFKLKLYPAHLNHKIRCEADEEEKFVKEMATSLKLPFKSEKVKIAEYKYKEGYKDLSLQEIARIVRQNFFLDYARQMKAEKIALGHQADDVVETILMRLLKGTATFGLAGIPIIREEKGIFFIRPLLYFWREDILNFCQKMNITYCEDSSNIKPIYLRNRIRMHLLPILREYNPQVKKVILNLSKVLFWEKLFWEEKVLEFKDKVQIKKGAEEIIISIEKLLSLPRALQAHLLRYFIEDVSGNLRIEFKHLHNILRKIKEKKKGGINLPKGIKIEYHYPKLVISKVRRGLPVCPSKREELPAIKFEYDLKIPGETYIKEVKSYITAQIIDKVDGDFEDRNFAYIDYDKSGSRLKVRNKREGDIFFPLGMKDKIKVKKFFIDHKIQKEERLNIPMVLAENQIVWIAGYRLDERFKVNGRTKKILKLHLKKVEQEV